MEKILVRSGVNPYDVYTPFEYLSKDLGGGNSGNLLFAASIFRNLVGKKRELFSNYYKLDLSKVDEINEKYNSFVIPLANAYRPNFNELDRLTKFIKKLKIPCIVTGVGGQFEYSPKFGEKFEFDDKAREFCNAVLDKSFSIGVRGTITADYLKKNLKIPEDKIEVIGCPSLFWFGKSSPKLKTKKEVYEGKITFHAGAAINPDTFDLLLKLTKYFKNKVFVPQANYDLRILYGAVPFKKVHSYPDSLESPLYKHNKVKFFTRADSWIDFYKREIDFSVGIKIHGTIAAILGGSHVLLLATDSRTRELAEFHKIPFVNASENINIFDLLKRLDSNDLMDPFYKEYKIKYENFKNFMSKNNIPILEENENIKNLKMIDNSEIGEVRSFLDVSDVEKIERISEIYSEYQRKINKLQNKLALIK